MIVKRKYLIYLMFLIAIFLTFSIIIQQVPIFADGSQHGGIIREITKTGSFPLEDFQGTQRNSLNSPISIRTPFLYYPSFYVLGATITSIGFNNINFSLLLLNILPIIISMFFIFLIFKKIFNRTIGLIGATIFIFSNIWLWMVVHRLMEPLIISLFLAIFYLILLKSELDTKNLILFSFLFVGLLLIKQSSFFIIFPLLLMVLFRFGFKKVIFLSLMIGLLFSPFVLFSINNSGSIGLTPPGIPLVDTFLLNPWWESNINDWEIELNNLSDSANLREKTLLQFKEIQLSPQNLLKSKNYLGIVQEFFIYPIMEKGHRGYSPITQKDTFRSFGFILILFVSFLPSYYFSIKKGGNFRFFNIALFLIILTILFGWMKVSVFRHFLFVTPLTIFFILYPLKTLGRKNRFIFLLILFLILLTLFINLGFEIQRDLNYQYTVGHRALPVKEGGLSETIEMSNFIKTNVPKEENIFTNIAEFSYYFDRKIIWDDRLFFIEKEEDVLRMLDHYNFKYVVVPFYSGTVNKDEWKYYLGIPKDSTFNSLLNDKNYFNLIKEYNGFKIYKITFENETNN